MTRVIRVKVNEAWSQAKEAILNIRGLVHVNEPGLPITSARLFTERYDEVIAALERHGVEILAA